MAYASVSINSVNPSVDIMTWLNAQLTANGWVFVETWVSGTKVCDVYRSPGAANGLGTDFYVGIYRASAQGAILWRLFELWDPATKLARKYAPADGTGRTVDADGSVLDAAGILLDSAVWYATTGRNTLVPRASVPTTYIIDVTADRFMVGSTNFATNFCYVGVFDTLAPPAMDPMPIVSTGGQFSLTSGVVTRELGGPATAVANWTIALPGAGTARTYAYAAPIGTGSESIIAAGELYRGQEAAPIWFASMRSINGSRRGVLRGPVTAYAGGALGDTLAVTQDDGSVRNYALVLVMLSGTNAQVYMRTS